MFITLLRPTTPGARSRFAPGPALRRVALTALASLGFAASGQAQTLALWPMETDATPTTVATGVSATAPTPADLVLSGSSVPQYSTLRGQALAPAADGSGWTGTALLRTRYEQFAVTAASGYSATLQTISLNTGVISTGNGRLGVSYSTDPTFATFTEVSAGTPTGSGTLTAGAGTFAAPVTLPNLSNTTGTSGTAAATTAFSFQLGASGASLTSGQTLYIRLYYNANTTSASRYALLRNVAVSGTATANGPACAAVTALSVGSITSTSASVSFTPGASNTSYTVTYTPSGGSATTVSPTPTASPVSLTGLAASTSYTVTVRSACSNGGTGNVVSTTFSTSAAPPCNDATNVSITNLTSTSAQLSFTPDASNTGQTVTITPQGGSTSTQTVVTSPASFSGLVSGTSYTVTIRSTCSGGGLGTLITRTFVAPVANSTLLQEWPLTANNADNAGSRSVGVTASTPTFTDLVSSTSGTVPAYSVSLGQAFAPAADGGGWGNTSNLSLTRYQEYTITATGSYTVRLDSLTFATGIMSSGNGRLGVRFSTNGFATAGTEVSGWTLPSGVSTSANSGFTNAFTGMRNLPVAPAAGSSLTAADTYRLALNGTTGVTLNPGQTLTVRLYYAVGTGSTARYALLRDVKAKGQATFTAPTCNDPTAVSVGNIGYTSASLAFTAGIGNTSYTVTLTPQGGSTTTLTPSNSPVALTGLTSNTTYTVTLRAACSGTGTQTATITRTFTTAKMPLQTWPLRVSYADTAAMRSVAVTASSASLVRFVPSSATTPASFSGRYGHAFAPVADGSGWNSMGNNASGNNSNNIPRRHYYAQFPVTAASGYSVRVDSVGFFAAIFGSSGTVAVAYSRDGFVTDSTETTASFTSPQATGSANASTPNNARISLALNGATGVTLAPGQVLTVRVYPKFSGTSTPRYALLRDVYVVGDGSAYVPADLTVSSAQTISGTYNNVTITSAGTATLGGILTVNGTLTVQSGGTLITACRTLNGTGNFVLAAGATLQVCNASGITASGATGAVQTTGSRSFSPDASYVYNGTVAQVTGNGLPATVRNITVNNNTAGLTLSQALSVSQLARLQSGNLTTAGNAFTLLSSASGTAMLVNTVGTVVGNGTMQRAITSPVTGPAYRHFSAPVSNTTVADLATAGFAPVVNPQYNSAAQPNLVTPFPTVFGYDESRIASVTSNYGAFDKGWASPASLTAAMTPTRGYTVNAPATATPIDFVGTFNNAAQNSGALSRGTDAQAGYHLLGNPYPSPLDWSTVTAAQRPGMDATMYVYESNGQYTGTYRSYTNGVGGASPIIAAGSGYFAHVSVAGTPGAVNLTNANRVTTFGTQPAFGRGTADTRPQLQLQVAGAGVQDEAFVYFQAGATAALDAEYDAPKLPNTTGLNLASLAGPDAVAINGLPLTGTTLLPLTLQVPQAGAFTFTVPTLVNFGSTQVYLRDAATGSSQLLTAGATYAFHLSTTTAGTTRFALEFRAAGALATQAGLTAAQVQVYPNPAHGSFTLLLPAVAGQRAVQATLLNGLGQAVATRSIALTAAGASSEFNVQGLAAGVYALRLQAGSQLLTQRVVVK